MPLGYSEIPFLSSDFPHFGWVLENCDWKWKLLTGAARRSMIQKIYATPLIWRSSLRISKFFILFALWKCFHVITREQSMYAEEVDLNMFRMCGKPNCLAAFSIPFLVLYASPFSHKLELLTSYLHDILAPLPPSTKYRVILSNIWKLKIHLDNKELKFIVFTISGKNMEKRLDSEHIDLHKCSHPTIPSLFICCCCFLLFCQF